MSSPLRHSPSASLSQPSPLGPSTPSPPSTTRLAAIATLRRAASQRESPSGPSHLSPSPSLERSSSLSLSPTPNPGASLERTASLLARSLAMAKLTGEKPPAPPASFGPLPTLGDLQARAAERSRGGRETMRRGLRRSNTVTGVGESWGHAAAAAQEVVRSPTLAPGEERAAARVNLMRKLSSRRLESSAPSDALAVGGRIERARPRSGSVGATPMDWRRGIDVPVLPVMASEEEVRTPLSPMERSETPFSASARSSGAWERERNRASSRARRAGETAWEFEDRVGRDDEEVLSASADESWSEPLSEQSSPAAEMLESPPVSPLAPNSPERPLLPLRRGSIPTHLFPSSRLASLSSNEYRRPPSASFGIAAVEETDVRRRGSSASSGILVGRTDSVATIALGRSGSLSLVMGEGSVGAGSSGSGEEDGEAQRLSEKVERKVAAGIARSGEGAFPPPEVGYTFPSPTTPRASEESVRSWGPGLAPEPDSPHVDKIGHEAPTFIPGRHSPTLSRHSQTNSRQFAPSPPPSTRAPVSPSPAFAATSTTHPTYQPLSIPEALGGLPPLPPSAFASLSFPASFTTPILGSVPSTSALQRADSKESLKKRWYPASIFKTGPTACPSSPHESVSTEMGRQSSAQSARTVTLHHSMETGPSPSMSMEFQPARAATPESAGSAPQSTYASSEEMRRGASGSSADSALFPVVSRQVRLPADQQPGAKILAHLDSILGTEELDTDAPSVLDHPPRQLLLHTPVLQVVNAQTVKDRHLFLFNDLLLIAKPIIEEHPSTGQPLPSTLESSFVVKSVVELRHLKLGSSDDADEAARSTTKAKRHPLLVAFIDRFANEPNRAIQTLIQKGGLANDAATIANLLFRNPELNRNQLGAYLAGPENRHVLRAYIEKFKFGGVRIDDALRMFLMTIRVPYSLQVAEHVLSVVAQQWTEANGNTGYDPSLLFSLVLAIMQLSDALHAGLHSDEGLFSYPNRSVSVDDFVSSFRPQDSRLLVPEELLARIYSSVRKERIEQASDNSVFTITPDIEAIMEPAKLPGRLTYRTPSQSITITIPAADPKFSIKLHGTDLKFDPPHLSFAKSNTQSFRVTGSAIGLRTMVLIKMGSNAPQYQGLPLNKAFSIERAFMQHTFQISFINHLNVKRKYMFSTLDANIRGAWTQALQKRTASCLATPLPLTKSLAAAEAVAVQVLRDALIAPEKPSSATSFAAPTLRPNTAAPRFGSISAAAALHSSRLGTPTRAAANGPVRSNSFSRTYAAGIGRVEADLKEERKAAAEQQRRGSRDEVVSAFAKKGKELTLLTEQNSLLPLVLSFLGAGAEVAPNPLSTQGTAFQLRPLSPTGEGEPQVI